MYKQVILSLMVILGCGASCHNLRIKGGSTIHTASTGAKTEMVQPENPKQSSTINTSSKITEKMVIPSSATVTIPSMVSTVNTPTNTAMVVALHSNSQPMTIERTIEDTANNSIGSSWKDTVGETLAKLGSMRWIQWFGIPLMLFGITSLFWPPLKAIVASTTTSIVFAIAGVGLLVLPVLVVGNEVVILFGCIGAAVAYFFIYRYSAASTKAQVLQGWIDKNGNGLRDDGE